MKEIIIKVGGMVCNGCENRVQNALKMIEGVEDAVANHTNGTVKVTLNKQVEEKILQDKIEDLGFEIM